MVESEICHELCLPDAVVPFVTNPANSLPVGLVTGRVFDRMVYTRLTLTVGTHFVVIMQWGFSRIIMLL